MKVAYTNHIGRSSRDKHSGKNTAILTLADLAATERHNNHDYSIEDVAHMQSAIDLDMKHLNLQYEMINGEFIEVEGHLDLEANVRRIYAEQFTEAVEEYNRRQIAKGHPERQIKSYIDKISEDKQQEVAVEGLLQIGSLEDWEGKSLEDRMKAVPILLHGLKVTLKELNQDDLAFLLAGVSVHLNEGTPHLHYVGVPVQYTPDAKNGLTKRVRKAAVFTRESLGTGMQDNVRAQLEPIIKKVYGWEFAEKKAGRNEDLTKNEYVNAELQENIREGQKQIGMIDAAIEVKAGSAKQQVDSYLQAIINDVVDDPENIYDDALFYISNCDDDQFEEISQKGRQLKKEILPEKILSTAEHQKQDLDRGIQNIVSGAYTPPKLTWEQRKQYWEVYAVTSAEFWERRQALQKAYHEALHNARSMYRDKMRAYYDTLYCLERGRSCTELMAAIIMLYLAPHVEKKLMADIEDLQHQKDQLIRNTGTFAKFSREYREELKEGKFPAEKYMDAMANAVETLDQEYRLFMGQDFEHNKNKLDPSLQEPETKELASTDYIERLKQRMRESLQKTKVPAKPSPEDMQNPKKGWNGADDQGGIGDGR